MKNKNARGPREIDILAGEVESLWSKSFTYVKKKEVATWKGALILAFVAGIAVTIVWSAKTDFGDVSKAAPASTLYFSPASRDVANGSTFTLDATIDPGTNQISGVRVDITYDQTKLSLTGITCSSTFSQRLYPRAGQPVVPSPEDGTARIDCAISPSAASVTDVSAVATFSFSAVDIATNSSVAFSEESMAVDDQEVGDVITSMVPALVNITQPADIIAPTITSFAIPSTSSSLIVPIITFTATDNTAVTGYMIKESSSTPLAGDSGWSATVDNYTFETSGSKTLYAWAKDAAGNVSSSLSDSVTITIADPEAPEVTAFVIPTTSDSLSIPITTFTATDNIDVTGYKITESDSAPSAGGSGWSATAPSSYLATTSGDKILYAWVKDAAGNVSSSLSAPVTISASAVVVKHKGDNDSKKKTKVAPRTIKNTPAKVIRGQIIKQYGKKFSKKSEVLLYFSRYGGGYYPPVKIMTTSKGTFSLDYRVTKPKGTYSWYAFDTKTKKKSKIRIYRVR